VQHSFEIKSTVAAATGVRPFASVRQTGIEALVLWCGTLPESSEADIYLPGASASDILALIPPSHAPILRVIDAHTLRCGGNGKLGGCVFLPLPPSLQERSLAGLLTIRLPAGVRDGQVFRVVGKQFAITRRVVGAFEFRIRVDANATRLLSADKDQLAIAKHQLLLTPKGDKWWPVLNRIVTQLGDRIGAFGGDPGSAFPMGRGTT
jgi:hypothetical protein